MAQAAKKEEHAVAHCESDDDFQKFLKDNAGKYVWIEYLFCFCYLATI